jgi:PIN domain nuclease of toxin-antitoxin system
LPRHHPDPCDRFIIATAVLQDAPVVAHDSVFSDYKIDVIG